MDLLTKSQSSSMSIDKFDSQRSVKSNCASSSEFKEKQVNKLIFETRTLPKYSELTRKDPNLTSLFDLPDSNHNRKKYFRKTSVIFGKIHMNYEDDHIIDYSKANGDHDRILSLSLTSSKDDSFNEDPEKNTHKSKYNGTMPLNSTNFDKIKKLHFVSPIFIPNSKDLRETQKQIKQHLIFNKSNDIKNIKENAFNVIDTKERDIINDTYDKTENNDNNIEDFNNNKNNRDKTTQMISIDRNQEFNNNDNLNSMKYQNLQNEMQINDEVPLVGNGENWTDSSNEDDLNQFQQINLDRNLKDDINCQSTKDILQDAKENMYNSLDINLDRSNIYDSINNNSTQSNNHLSYSDDNSNSSRITSPILRIQSHSSCSSSSLSQKPSNKSISPSQKIFNNHSSSSSSKQILNTNDQIINSKKNSKNNNNNLDDNNDVIDNNNHDDDTDNHEEIGDDQRFIDRRHLSSSNHKNLIENDHRLYYMNKNDEDLHYDHNLLFKESQLFNCDHRYSPSVSPCHMHNVQGQLFEVNNMNGVNSSRAIHFQFNPNHDYYGSISNHHESLNNNNNLNRISYTNSINCPNQFINKFSDSTARTSSPPSMESYKSSSSFNSKSLHLPFTDDVILSQNNHNFQRQTLTTDTYGQYGLQDANIFNETYFSPINLSSRQNTNFLMQNTNLSKNFLALSSHQNNNDISPSLIIQNQNTKKKNRNENRIKKPLNAFMIFMKEKRQQYIDKYEVKQSALINQILAKDWKSLSRLEQEPYYEKAKAEKKLHQELHPLNTKSKTSSNDQKMCNNITLKEKHTKLQSNHNSYATLNSIDQSAPNIQKTNNERQSIKSSKNILTSNFNSKSKSNLINKQNIDLEFLNKYYDTKSMAISPRNIESNLSQNNFDFYASNPIKNDLNFIPTAVVPYNIQNRKILSPINYQDSNQIPTFTNSMMYIHNNNNHHQNQIMSSSHNISTNNSTNNNNNLTMMNKKRKICPHKCTSTLGIERLSEWCSICLSRRRVVQYAKIMNQYNKTKDISHDDNSFNASSQVSNDRDQSVSSTVLNDSIVDDDHTNDDKNESQNDLHKHELSNEVHNNNE